MTARKRTTTFTLPVPAASHGDAPRERDMMLAVSRDIHARVMRVARARDITARALIEQWVARSEAANVALLARYDALHDALDAERTRSDANA